MLGIPDIRTTSGPVRETSHDGSNKKTNLHQYALGKVHLPQPRFERAEVRCARGAFTPEL
jgi:hypothetical protein